MITFFACPKPFKDNFNIIQRNAIRSWLNLPIEKEIILVGNEEGTKEICEEFKLVHLKDIKVGVNNIPLLNDIFKKVEKIASYEYLCYINADIILISPNFNELILKLSQFSDKFLASGRRRDVYINRELIYDENEMEWLKNIDPRSNPEIKFGGTDYFVFKKGIFANMPDFLIGRFWWDHWIVYYAMKNNIPTIDLTYSLISIHQNHDYSYDIFSDFVYGKMVKNPDIVKNFFLAGYGSVFDIKDFKFIMEKNGKIKHKEVSKLMPIRNLLAYIYLLILFSFGNVKIINKFLINFMKILRHLAKRAFVSLDKN